MAELRDVVVDCAHPAPLARFWAAVLDGYAVAPYDDEELARLRAMGVDDPEDDPSVLVEAAAGRPRYFFVRVSVPTPGKNRWHLDLQCDDFDTELARLLSLGARVVAPLPAWTVLADPEGNQFCLMR